MSITSKSAGPLADPLDDGQARAVARSDHRASAGPAAGPSEPPSPPLSKATRWAWNLPLLAVSLGLLAALGPTLVGLHHWQSARIGGQLVQLADRAAENNQPVDEARWLQRYLSLRPDDTPTRIRLAWLHDDHAEQWSEVDQARRQLARALAVIGDAEPGSAVDQETIDATRRRLIERLLQLGGGWFIEAERQILALDAPPENPQILEQLAKSLLGQERNQVPRPSGGQAPERATDFWRWAAAQPLGDVVQMATDANPDSVELAGTLIELYLDRPEQFRAGQALPAHHRTEQRPFLKPAQQLLQQLSQRQDDGQAQWTALHFGAREGVGVDLQPLAVVADGAVRRLQDHAEGWEESDAELAVRGRKDGAYQPLWDVQLVLHRADTLAETQAIEAAQQLYTTLTELPEGMCRAEQLEAAYVGLGQACWRSDEQPAAREIWQAGNERLGGGSLGLAGLLATTAADLLPLDEARREVQRFSQIVQTTSVQLADATSNLTPARRRELKGRLDTASWRVDLIRARLDDREGNYQQAAQQLERALNSQLDIEDELRVEVAKHLANIYSRQELWDQAGRALDAAILFNPTDRELRLQAATAWKQAAADASAAEQWLRADDGSFTTALAYAEAVAASLARRAPAQRDVSPLQRAIATAQSRLDQALAAGHPTPDAWRLAILRMSLPAERLSTAEVPEVAGDSEGESIAAPAASTAAAIVQLSEQYPDAALLQALAALSLTGNDAAAAAKAVARLKAIEDLDPLLLLETEVRMAAQAGDPEAAVGRLRQAELELGSNVRFVRFAAQFLRGLGHHGEAIELLQKLEPTQHDMHSLLQLGEYLLAFRQPAAPDAAGANTAANRTGSGEIDAALELKKVDALLRKQEGDQGTHWRLLEARRLLQAGGDAQQRRRNVNHAAILQSEIVSRRPRWTPGLALGGEVAARQGDARRAVEMLRRATAAGATNPATVMLLVQQLNRLGETAAAEQELARLEGLVDSVGELSALAVDLSLGQRQFEQALERARAGVAARPDDPEAMLILAQVLVTAARGDAQRAEDLRKEATDVLMQANKLTGGRQLSVWQALFRLQLEHGGREPAREVLQAMEQSPLPPHSRALTVAAAHLALRDWDQAKTWLAQAQASGPTDPQVALAFATLHQMTQQPEAMLQSLEEAHRMAPQREDIRRRLALALASGATGDVPWPRINQLVGAERPEATHLDQAYHALILITRGDAAQIEQARQSLTKLVEVGDEATADDAARLLLSVERKRWEAAVVADDSEEAVLAAAQCRRLYERLVRRGVPRAVELYGYADLLLRTDRPTEAQLQADRLAELAPEHTGTLELRLRLAQGRGDDQALQSIVTAWLQQDAFAGSPAALATASAVLLKLELSQQALERVAEAYQEDPGYLALYVLTLRTVEQFEQAFSVCLSHFERDPGPESIRLLAEVAVQRPALDLVTEPVERLLQEAVKMYPTETTMLESIGTLRLSQHRYADAIAIYSVTEKLNPSSLLTLNNLAVALAEQPGRYADALTRIERAIELFGRNPELLDTLGMVHLRGNQLREAETTLREAYTASNQPHHLFHLILALKALQQDVEVEQLWRKLDLSKLKPEALTSTDRMQLQQLQQRLGTPAT